MDQKNFNNLQIIYQNMLVQQSVYASMIAASLPLQIKIEPEASLDMPQIPIQSLPSTPRSITRSSLSPCSISLDTEIPRDEIEGDIEVILVKNFKDILKNLDTTVKGMRGKKYGYREVLEEIQTHPIYPNLNSSKKRDRTESFGASSSEDHHSKKIKIEADDHNSSCGSDNGRLVIDWDEHEKTDEKPVKVEKIVSQSTLKKPDDIYQPYMIRFERLKQNLKKKPRVSIDNLDLTYHSNMARQFPDTEKRSEEQQNRRDKNTLAARISRNKNKAYEQELMKQSKEAVIENINLKRQIACLRVYANSLLRMKESSKPRADTDFGKLFEDNIKNMVNKTE